MQIVHLLPTSAVMGGGGKCCVLLKKLAQEGEKESKTRKVWQGDSEYRETAEKFLVAVHRVPPPVTKNSGVLRSLDLGLKD